VIYFTFTSSSAVAVKYLEFFGNAFERQKNTAIHVNRLLDSAALQPDWTSDHSMVLSQLWELSHLARSCKCVCA